MTTSQFLEQLAGAPVAHGLFDKVGDLQHGRTRLDLESYQYDPVRKLPLYVFKLLADDGAVVGQYHFAPGDPDQVGEIGNAGGHVDAAYRDKGHSKDCIKALKSLAWRHGMASFIVTCPKSNGAARTALQQVGKEIDRQDGDMCFYEIPAT
ncbi:hypothetical protein [Massilia aerilata]|uniref:GNAT family N-acetyltransferase n=1 Tax=Massilia aerilata TaxID=453817 RepID=A0ABW0S201_9BURK